jgi:hypothetical protein
VRTLGSVFLTQEIAQHLGSKRAIASPQDVGAANAYPVTSFQDLIQHVARLAVLNKDCVFYYRGQNRDYGKGNGSSSLYPTIYRGAQVHRQDILNRFALLDQASSALYQAVVRHKLEGHDEVRKRLVQWSLLQHYEVCATPLLDLTSSLRMACNFALLNPNPPEPTVYVCGLPYTTGRISVNSEHDTVNVRLLGICPPAALRPLLQEGHVVGTYEVTADYANKSELDFCGRLIAKFSLPMSTTFRRELAGFDKEELFPSTDPLLSITEEVRSSLREFGEVSPSVLGYFLETWTKLEQILLDTARFFGKDVRSVGTAARVLRDRGLPEDVFHRLLRATEIRNTAVHKPQDANEGMLLQARDEIERLTDWAEKFYRTTARQFQEQDEYSGM